MMRVLFLFFAIMLFVPSVAQKKEISEARSYVKSRSDLDKAESLMRGLLEDTVNHDNEKIYLTLVDAVRAQYEVANEKLYLKEVSDTAQFFKTARNMFQVYETLDSFDMRPDKKGRLNLKYRKKNAEYLAKYRRNLYNGGIYFIGRNDFGSAFDMLDTYIDCRRQPLFSSYKEENADSLYASAAFWTVFCGHKLQNPEKMLKYSDLALLSPKYRRRTFIYLSDAYLQKEDTAMYINTLRRGFQENKTSRFFFTRLMDYYNAKNQLDSALNLSDAALEEDSTGTLFLFAKSNTLLNMGRYKECIAISDCLLARNDTLADVYLNAAVSYINLALEVEKSGRTSKADDAMIVDYYKKALPYMEKYREMAPEDKERWATSLYNIYLKLNMGRKFEEISGILRNMRR